MASSEGHEIGKKFLAESSPPKDINEIQKQLNAFLNLHNSSGNPFIVVTSGGTTVPLEENTVRFIDNFSTGTRGATSAEYLLANDFNVIFLHRRGSVCPFIRHIQKHTSKYLDLQFFQCLQLSDNQITLNTTADESKDNSDNNIADIFAQYNKYCGHKSRLLMISYESVIEYFHYTIECCKMLAKVDPKSPILLYMAAAVSDFYIPPKLLSKDKIQSSDGPPQLQLENTPKLLGYFKELCGKRVILVSFKLETKDDTQFLFGKARKAIAKYGSNVVCSNILHTRYNEVWMVTAQDAIHVKKQGNTELEVQIVKYLKDYISTSKHYIASHL